MGVFLTSQMFHTRMMLFLFLSHSDIMLFTTPLNCPDIPNEGTRSSVKRDGQSRSREGSEGRVLYSAEVLPDTGSRFAEKKLLSMCCLINPGHVLRGVGVGVSILAPSVCQKTEQLSYAERNQILQGQVGGSLEALSESEFQLSNILELTELHRWRTEY